LYYNSYFCMVYILLSINYTRILHLRRLKLFAIQFTSYKKNLNISRAFLIILLIMTLTNGLSAQERLFTIKYYVSQPRLYISVKKRKRNTLNSQRRWTLDTSGGVWLKLACKVGRQISGTRGPGGRLKAYK